MAEFRTFRDREASLWQSAVEETLVRQATGGPKLRARIAAGSAPPKIDWDRIAAEPMSQMAADYLEARSNPAAAQKRFAAARGAILGTVGDCGHIALELAEAEIAGDEDAIHRLTDEFNFGTCDPRWFETISVYESYFKWQGKTIPYRSGGDYVLDVSLPPTATIGIIGDWGTGSSIAERVLQQVADKKPDLVLHLGDIYYSGTMLECQSRFLAVARSILGNTPILSLAGNHDMYSGGAGYYWLVDQLKQQASYFCIRNDDWQILAMDTGYHDYNPFSVSTNVTFLTEQEAAWHHEKIRTAGKRKTALLSHHQLFTAFDPIAGQAVNQRLLNQFKDVLGQVAIWFWGHEHRLDIYDPYLGLSRGRCIGCSAIPQAVTSDYFNPTFPDVTLLKNGGKPVQLGDDHASYNHAFAIMKLDGPNAHVAYFQDSDPAHPLFEEVIH